MKKITVITPTTGRDTLIDCVESVRRQSLTDVEHYVVIDGAERVEKAERVLSACRAKPTVIRLKEATGKDGFYGHRIYGALPYLCEGEYVAFLDEDNWYEQNHLATLVQTIEQSNLDWAYSLRKICGENGTFIADDNCQSLGWWPAFDGAYHHLDTSCYMIKREIAIRSSAVWNRRGYAHEIRDPDRELCRWLMYHHPRFFTTGEYTVNYRLHDRSPDERTYFGCGNRLYAEMFRIFPWANVQLRTQQTLPDHTLPVFPRNSATLSVYETAFFSNNTVALNSDMESLRAAMRRSAGVQS